jgi:hypothetical protein
LAQDVCYCHWTHGSRVSKCEAPQGRHNAVAPRFFIHGIDQISGRRFLVDTEASLAFIKEELLTMQAESLAWLGAVNFRQGGAVDVKVAS